MKHITIYGKPYCGYCEAAKALCKTIGAEYDYLDVMTSPEIMARHRQLAELHGHFTMPLIFADDEFIGGFTELQAAAKAGKLL